MTYRSATLEDIPQIFELQKKYHVLSINDEDKKDGFVTTLFSEEQLKDLIEKENGISIACDGDKVVGYAMAASWEYWSQWPLFQHMIKELPLIKYLDKTPDLENSYQYGPICIDKAYRSSDVLPHLFDYSREVMSKRYPILITFINHINPRSYAAHTKKLGLDVLRNFQFNNNNYYELGYDTSKKVKVLK